LKDIIGVGVLLLVSMVVSISLVVHVNKQVKVQDVVKQLAVKSSWNLIKQPAVFKEPSV